MMKPLMKPLLLWTCWLLRLLFTDAAGDETMLNRPSLPGQSLTLPLKEYERQRDFLLEARRTGLDRVCFPELLGSDDSTRVLTISKIKSSNLGIRRTPKLKDSARNELEILASKFKMFHNNITWDNICYDETRLVFTNLGSATLDKPDVPYTMHLPISVCAAERDFVSMSAVVSPAGFAEEVYLYTLGASGEIKEFTRSAEGWRYKVSKFPHGQCLSCAVMMDKKQNMKKLYILEKEGNIWEGSQSMEAGTGYSKTWSWHDVTSDLNCKVHPLSKIQCVEIQEIRCCIPGTGQNIERALVFIDHDECFRVAWLEPGMKWQSERLDVMKPCMEKTDAKKFDVGACRNSLCIFFCNNRDKCLSEIVWKGPNKASACNLPQKPYHGPDYILKISAVCRDKNKAVYYITDDHQLWESHLDVKQDAWHAWCMSNILPSSANLKLNTDSILLGQPLTGDNAKEVIFSNGKHFAKMSVGGGSFEGGNCLPKNEWKWQTLTSEALNSLPHHHGGGNGVCGISSRGTHHLFYLSKCGTIVEL